VLIGPKRSKKMTIFKLKNGEENPLLTRQEREKMKEK
jgi:hypothetical protein